MQEELQRSRLEEAFLIHREHLREVARRIVRGLDLADDVIQDAYLKVVQMRGKTEVREPLHYCAQIVRNVALDFYRRRSTEAVYRVYVEDEEIATHRIDITPERILAAKRTLEGVAIVLADLPQRTRTAFLLSRNEGMTQREIGKKLECSATTVNFMIRDADVALEKCRDAAYGA